MIKLIIISLATIILFTGCVHSPYPNGSCADYGMNKVRNIDLSKKGTHITDSPLQFMGCTKEYNDMYKKWEQKGISKAMPYALMSSNVYHSTQRFNLESIGWYFDDYFDKYGFQSEAYLKKDNNGNVVKVSISFRGTDESLDWIFTNLKFSFNSSKPPYQYTMAKCWVNLYKEKYPNAKFVFTGHSLGGALAHHVSFDYEGSEVYVFNESPRYWVQNEKKIAKSRTGFAIYEKNEILTILRKIWFLQYNDENSVKPLEVDFRLGSMTTQHEMYKLARGLLLVSAKTDKNSDAISLFNENLNCRKEND
jgi:hypothetical protein